MDRLLLNCLFMALTLPVGAIELPSQAELDRISYELSLAGNLAAQVRTKKDEIRALSRPGRGTSTELRKAGAELKNLERQRDVAYKKVINRGLVAYGIAEVANGKPRMPVLPMNTPAMDGTPREWVVIFGEPRERLVPLPKGNAVKWPEVEKEKRAEKIARLTAEMNGITTDDGVTLVWDDLGSPAALARLLWHERRHLELFSDPETAKWTRDEREMKILQEEVLLLQAFGFKGRELETRLERTTFRIGELNHITNWNPLLRGAKRLSERWAGGIQAGHDSATNIRGLYVSKEALEAIRKESSRIRRQVEADAEARREREERERKAGRRRAEQQSDEERRRQEAADMGYRWLEAWLLDACRSDAWKDKPEHPLRQELSNWKDTHFEAIRGRRPSFRYQVPAGDRDCVSTVMELAVDRANSPGITAYYLELFVRDAFRTAPWSQQASPRPAPQAPRTPPQNTAPKPPPPRTVDDFPEPRGGRARSDDPCAESGTFGGVTTGCR